MNVNPIMPLVSAVGLGRRASLSEELPNIENVKAAFDSAFDIDKVAQAVFEGAFVYRKHFLGEEHNPDWESLIPDVKSALIKGVERVSAIHFENIVNSFINSLSYNQNSEMYLGTLSFSGYELYNESRQSHENWMKSRLEAGFTYGKETKFENKEHSDLLPFSSLSLEKQFKSVFFFTQVGFYVFQTFQKIDLKKIIEELPVSEAKSSELPELFALLDRVETLLTKWEKTEAQKSLKIDIPDDGIIVSA